MDKQLIEDLRALFAEWRRLGWFDGYEPGEDPGPDTDSLTDGGPAADRGPHLYAPGAGPDVKFRCPGLRIRDRGRSRPDRRPARRSGSAAHRADVKIRL
jgi:hypothetical protein